MEASCCHLRNYSALSYYSRNKLRTETRGHVLVNSTLSNLRTTYNDSDYALPLRTLTDNMLVGVSKGFEKRLQLVGVGYRGTVEGNDLVLSLGFSHPVRMKIPDNLKVKVEENTRIIISGYDKCDIGLFAASIRRWRPPEPYKGKGVRYANEVVRLKEGKAGKKK
ncbi:unnamed protein product [Linum tenue]|uniref:Large ribosomal subunit protein uL6 alpha-beta domain-containing protein n=1 Tax=Linum tenue TaxID=586396 RepID=A0AAV0QYP9_9ROSI|nr:unnamed protein product [Linum tenue]